MLWYIGRVPSYRITSESERGMLYFSNPLKRFDFFQASPFRAGRRSGYLNNHHTITYLIERIIGDYKSWSKLLLNQIYKWELHHNDLSMFEASVRLKSYLAHIQCLHSHPNVHRPHCSSLWQELARWL